jgi:hypothetical protein
MVGINLPSEPMVAAAMIADALANATPATPEMYVMVFI